MYKHHFPTFFVYTLKKQGSRWEFKTMGANFYLFESMGANIKHQYDFLKILGANAPTPTTPM